MESQILSQPESVMTQHTGRLPYHHRSMPFDPLEILEKACHACETLFPEGIHDAYLYGSYARGDFDEESDVDILLAVDVQQLGEYHAPLAEITSNLGLEYDRLISVVIVPWWHLVRYAEVLPFYKNVLKEGLRFDAKGNNQSF